MSEHAFTLGELTTFNYIRPMYTIPSLEYEGKRVFFIPPSVGNGKKCKGINVSIAHAIIALSAFIS